MKLDSVNTPVFCTKSKLVGFNPLLLDDERTRSSEPELALGVAENVQYGPIVGSFPYRICL